MMDFAWLSEVADLFLPGAAEASRGLDPAIFQTVVRGSVLVLNLGGWAMLRAIERLYEQSTVRAILDAVLWQSLGAFTIVGAEPGVAMVSMCRPCRIVFSRWPASSSPMKPATVQRAPSEARLSATLAAPPAVQESREMSITGTGASGEMRVASPQM